MGNTFGHLFRITTWGESHGGAVGVVVDGCPPRLALTEADIQAELDRRRPGQSRITTQRQEEDVVGPVEAAARGELCAGGFQQLPGRCREEPLDQGSRQPGTG